MRNHILLPTVLALATLTMGVANADAQVRRGGGARVGQAVPRAPLASRSVIVPRVVVPYRSYGYYYRPGFSLGIYAGYPYGFATYGYPYGYYPGYGYDPYAYGPPYGAGYVTAGPGEAYGGLRIQGAPKDAQVFADGYYLGIVDDVDGVFQHANLPAGPHQIELRVPGYPPTQFDVRIEPGQTITYHADRR